MIKDKQSKTFYRDGVQMTTEDENIIDTLAATLGFPENEEDNVK